MEYRGKYNPKIVFPSFSLVVNRFILHRPARQPVVRKKEKEYRLVWVNVPEYEPEPVAVRGERVADWAMTTIDYRNEDVTPSSQTGTLALTPVSALYLRKPTGTQERPVTPVLKSIEDDAMSVVSDLELSI